MELESPFLIIHKHARQLVLMLAPQVRFMQQRACENDETVWDVRPAQNRRARNKGHHDFSRKSRTRTSRNHSPPHTRQANTKAKTTLNQLASART